MDNFVDDITHSNCTAFANNNGTSLVMVDCNKNDDYNGLINDDNEVDPFSLLPESEISTLTETQGKVLALLPIVPSILSIFGSSMIIYLVTKQGSRRLTPYRRLMLGMSACDIANSSFLPFSTFLLPRQTSQRVWAFGNDRTCSLLGFCSQLAFSGILYNTMISFYFLLTIRFSYRDQDISKRIEPLMHALSLGFPIVTAIIGLGFGMYNEAEVGAICWVSDYPDGCGSGPGVQRGDPHYIPCKSPLIAMFFGGTCLLLLLVSLIINNSLILAHVRSTILRSRRRYAHGTMTTGGSRQDSQTKRIRAVATQAFLYVAACMITYSWSIILRILEGMFSFDAEDENRLYPMLVTNVVCFPMQGFFNFLIYIRPEYLRVRKNHSSQSRLWAFRRAITPDVGQGARQVAIMRPPAVDRQRSAWDISGSMTFVLSRIQPNKERRHPPPHDASLSASQIGNNNDSNDNVPPNNNDNNNNVPRNNNEEKCDEDDDNNNDNNNDINYDSRVSYVSGTNYSCVSGEVITA